MCLYVIWIWHIGTKGEELKVSSRFRPWEMDQTDCPWQKPEGHLEADLGEDGIRIGTD